MSDRFSDNTIPHSNFVGSLALCYMFFQMDEAERDAQGRREVLLSVHLCRIYSTSTFQIRISEYWNIIGVLESN